MGFEGLSGLNQTKKNGNHMPGHQKNTLDLAPPGAWPMAGTRE